MESDLAAMPDRAGTGLAAAALALARELDDATNSATSKAACARSLVIVLNALRSESDRPAGPDGLDVITANLASKRGKK